MNAPVPDILCIGSVLWDMIGRHDGKMHPGDDRPGRIRRLPGGVALNIAVTLARLGLRPALISVVGRDAQGDALVAAARGLGLSTDHLLRHADLPTDRYMAIEAAGELVAAIADTASLEAAGAAILAPLLDGRLGSAARPWAGPIALDGNLTADLLARIATDPALAAADLRIAPASPGKASRLAVFRGHPGATLYVNRAEAALLSATPCPDATNAARALVAGGWARVLVTDGSAPAAFATADGVITRTPPPVDVARITGAGDCFMAAHVAADLAGASAPEALAHALAAAARHISERDD